MDERLSASRRTTPLIIIGAGGDGREVLDIANAMNAVGPTWEILGFAADGGGDLEEIEALGVPFLGSVDTLDSVIADAAGATEGPQFVVGIGSGAARQSIDERLLRAGWKAATLIHPSATLGARCEIGPGTVITAGVRMTTNVRLGRHVHLNLNSTVSHDCVLGNYVTISPGVNVAGRVTLDDGVECGTGAAILPNLRVGRNARVGAGAVVTTDCPPNCTVVGVPARAAREEGRDRG